MSEALLSIDKVAKKSGMASSALRYYERYGLIKEGVKIRGRRHYDPAVLRRLSIIRTCQKIGFSLSEIATLLDVDSRSEIPDDGDNPPDRGSWQDLVLARRALVVQQVEQLHEVLELLDSVLTCSCHELSDCPRLAPEGDLSLRSAVRPRLGAEQWNMTAGR